MKIAIIDYDVHHGNGTQQAFWADSDTLFISVHQDSNYPLGSGRIDETGHPHALRDGFNTTINIPLPPGSGKGAYEYAFDTIVTPAVTRFSPDMIFVSSGFDASYADPLAAMILSTEDYRNMTKKLLKVAEVLCDGRILFSHEGGYSKDFVPFCCLAVIEELSGVTSAVEHSYDDVYSWGYQDLQSHQASIVDSAAVLAGLPPGVTTITRDSSMVSPHDSCRGNFERVEGTENECDVNSTDSKIAAAMKVLLDCIGEDSSQLKSTASKRKKAILSQLMQNC